jgi:hypothetical protein
MAKRKPNKVLLAVIGGLHLLITAAAWRDLNGRRPEQVRGSKMLWRILSALNTGGSLAYLVIGRKSAAPNLSQPIH